MAAARLTSVLPPLPDPFVGRDELVAAVVDRLGTERVVTLVGLGGIGKTTVASAAARGIAATGRAAHFCELETETEPRAALERVCRDLGLDPGGDPVEALGGVPAGTLVVLDNVEQVEGLGPAVAEVVERSGLCILTTSRRALHLRTEHVVSVPPLSLESRDGEPSPAASLFLARVARVRPSLDRRGAREAGERVCAVLDGIPLAIGLAAARSRVITVDQLARRLEDGADSALDRTRLGDVPARQASLAAIVAAAVEALDPSARTALTWLASLEGWTSVDLAEAVVGPELETSLVEAVEDLVDGGLADLDPHGRIRLRRPIREFVERESAGQRPHIDKVVVARVRHMVCDLTPVLLESSDDDVLSRISRDADPIAGALARGITCGSGDDVAGLVIGLHRYWLLSGRIPEGRRSIEAVSASGVATVADLARIEVLRGTFASYLGDSEAQSLLVDALAVADRLEVPVDRIVVNGWCSLAAARAQRQDHVGARDAGATARRLAEATGDPVLVGLANDVVGYVASYAGDHAAALEAHLAGLATVRRAGHEYDVVNLLNAVTEDLVGLGRADEAVVMSEEAFDLVRRGDSRPLLAAVLTMRGLALVRRHAGARGHRLPDRGAAPGPGPPARPVPTEHPAGPARGLFRGCPGRRERRPPVGRRRGAARGLRELDVGRPSAGRAGRGRRRA